MLAINCTELDWIEMARSVDIKEKKDSGHIYFNHLPNVLFNK